MTIYDELQKLIGCFRKESIEYALCGGLAMAVHGWPRQPCAVSEEIDKADPLLKRLKEEWDAFSKENL